MANVSSWADIVDAVTNATTDITLYLTKDIDLAEEPDYVFGITPLALNGYNLILNGNGHQIINLANDLSTSGGIFIADANSTCAIEIQNVDFVNLVLNNAALIQSLNAGNELEVTNCGFEGKRYGTSYLFDVPSAHFTGCFFDMPWIGTEQNPQKYTSLVTNPTSSSTVTNYEAEYCWFREHYTNWTIKTWSYTNVNSTDNSTLWSFYYIKINGCYIDGDMTMSNDTHSSKNTHIPIDVQHHANMSSFTPTKMSVFDVEVSCVGTRTIADRGNFFGLYINKLINENQELITTWEYSYNSSDSKPYPIIATEAEASDINWLHDHGFAI